MMKININYPLSGEALSLACRINAWHMDNGKTDIVFSDTGPYPHVTLLMGEIAPDSLTEVNRRIRALLNYISRPTVCFTAPHKPAFDSEYVFLGFKRPDCLREVKEKMSECLRDIFNPSEYGSVDIAPHVTLAYITHGELYKPFPSTEYIKTSWTPKKIAVSKTGTHGTCVSILELINLETAEQEPPDYRCQSADALPSEAEVER